MQIRTHSRLSYIQRLIGESEQRIDRTEALIRASQERVRWASRNTRQLALPKRKRLPDSEVP